MPAECRSAAVFHIIALELFDVLNLRALQCVSFMLALFTSFFAPSVSMFFAFEVGLDPDGGDDSAAPNAFGQGDQRQMRHSACDSDDRPGAKAAFGRPVRECSPGNSKRRRADKPTTYGLRTKVSASAGCNTVRSMPYFGIWSKPT